MTTTIEAIYENGVLRPLKPIEGMAEHSKVTLELVGQAPAPSWMSIVGIMPKEDADEMRRIIDEEFGKVNPDDW